MQFEWDERKNKANVAKHGVSFETAKRIFEAPVLTIIDDRVEYGEVREKTIGIVDGLAFLVVIHTARDGKCRIISARPTSKAERKEYEQALQKGIIT